MITCLEDGVVAIEVARLLLYVVEWVISFIIWGLTHSKLEANGICYFGRGANCGAVLFFGITGSLILTAVIAKYVLQYFIDAHTVRRRVESYTFLGLATLWFFLGIATATATPAANTSAGDAVVALSWVNGMLALATAGIAYHEVQQGKDDDPL